MTKTRMGGARALTSDIEQMGNCVAEDKTALFNAAFLN